METPEERATRIRRLEEQRLKRTGKPIRPVSFAGEYLRKLPGALQMVGRRSWSLARSIRRH